VGVINGIFSQLRGEGRVRGLSRLPDVPLLLRSSIVTNPEFEGLLFLIVEHFPHFSGQASHGKRLLQVIHPDI